MFGCLRNLAIAGAVLAVPGGDVLATPGDEPAGGWVSARGYLPAVGPAPLRFLAAPQPATNLVKMALPPPPVETNAPSEPEVKKTVPVPTPPPAPVVSSASTDPFANQPDPTAGTPSADPMVSPQMLMRYFNHSTNGVSSGVIAPFNFAPPPEPRPSSSATYTTGPPQ